MFGFFAITCFGYIYHQNHVTTGLGVYIFFFATFYIGRGGGEISAVGTISRDIQPGGDVTKIARESP